MSGNRWPWAIRCWTVSNQPWPLPVAPVRAISPSSRGITVRVKIGVDLDHLGRQQDGLVGIELVDPRAQACRRRWTLPSAGRRRARRTTCQPVDAIAADLLHHRRDGAQEGGHLTDQRLMASGSPSMTSSTACGMRGFQIAHGGPHHSCDAAELAEHRVVGFGGVGRRLPARTCCTRPR